MTLTVSDILKEKNSLFIALTETWLADHKDAEVEINDYRIIRADRSRIKKKYGRHSGGVALYIRNDVSSTFKPVLQYSNSVNELLIVYSKKENILISVIYRQPDDSSHGHPSTYKEFSEILKKLKDTFDTFAEDTLPDIFMLGDFNLPHASWPDGSSTKGASSDEKQCLYLLSELANEFTLQQCICKKTHKDGNVLDLVWTNNRDLVHSYSCIPTNPKIRHYYLYIV